MAKAKATKATTITGVTLELSAVEAGVLLEILYYITGSTAGPRGAADSVGEALRGLGIGRCGGGTGRIDLPNAKEE